MMIQSIKKPKYVCVTSILLLIFIVSTIFTGCSSSKSLLGKWNVVSINDETYENKPVSYEFLENNVAHFSDSTNGAQYNMWYKVNGNELMMSTSENMPEDEWVSNQFKVSGEKLTIIQGDLTIVLEKE